MDFDQLDRITAAQWVDRIIAAQWTRIVNQIYLKPHTIDINVVNHAIKQFKDINNCHGGMTPLYNVLSSKRNGHPIYIEIIKELIEAGANVNCEYNGINAIDIYLKPKFDSTDPDMNVLRLLISAGAISETNNIYVEFILSENMNNKKYNDVGAKNKILSSHVDNLITNSDTNFNILENKVKILEDAYKTVLEKNKILIERVETLTDILDKFIKS